MQFEHHPVDRPFADWRLALKSIFAFWAFYALTVVARAFLSEDAGTIIANRAIAVAVGIVMTLAVYAALSLFAHRAPVGRRALVAVLASLLAASAMAGTLIALERYQERPQDEVHYVSAEGYKITELGQSTVIERPGQQPLTVTWPKIDKLGPWMQFRIAADSMVVWSFFFLGWAAFYIAMIAQGRTHELRQRAVAAESAAKSAEVRALRYQVNPHFLFNTLNSLSSLVMSGRNERAEEMLLALSTFFRTSLSMDATADVSLAEEIELQRLYLDIEKVRFPSRLKVDIDIPAELQSARLPALILQPIVENAIKYGVSRSRGKVSLRIAAERLDPGRFEIRISNDGKATAGGRASETGTGLGLANVCQRLDARFDGKANCSFGPTDDGYAVRLIIPIERGDG